MSIEYPNDNERQVLSVAEKLMEETMSKYDPSHDKYHVQRVRKTALVLANSLDPKPDLLVVELAALLHDVLDKKYVNVSLTPTPGSESSSSTNHWHPLTFFKPFFESVQPHVDLFSDDRAALIAEIIDNVSWSTEKKLRAQGRITDWHETCVELHCVQDADRLDAIGAIGAMRCAGYSCTVNRPLVVPPEDPLHGDTAEAHFQDKLLKIKDSLKTDLGRKLGQERHDFMVAFLDALSTEQAIHARQ